MAKHKKKHSKKADLSDDLFDVAAQSVKQFRKVTDEIGKLSLAQKLVGSVVVLAAGLIYLEQRRSSAGSEPTSFAHPRLDEAQTSATLVEEQEAPSRRPATGKGHKGAKAGKSHAAHRPPTRPDDDNG